MSTDYLNRVYWPNRSNGANRTTYGFHYGSQVLLNELAAGARRGGGGGASAFAATAHGRDGRMDALRLLEKRPQTAAAGLPRPSLEHMHAYSSWSAAGRSGENGDGPRPRPRSYSSRKSLPPSASAAAASDVALSAGSVNDPFVPNMSYKEHARKKRLAAAGTAWQDAHESINNHVIWQRLRKAVRPTVESIGVSETSTRMGRGGGSWRHIKEVLQGMGTRIVFIDGGPSLDDLHRMRSGRLGQYPAGLARQQTAQNESAHVDTVEQLALESANWRVMR